MNIKDNNIDVLMIKKKEFFFRIFSFFDYKAIIRIEGSYILHYVDVNNIGEIKGTLE